MFRRKKNVPEQDEVVLERTNAPSLQPQAGPFPTAQNPGSAYMMPNKGQFNVVSNGMPMSLPTYTSIDEYGRAYNPVMFYAPQPNSAPVPVATPSKIVQLNPIVSPVAFVPYSTQNQPMYQLDDDQ